MDILSVVALAGGLAFFLYGMNVLSAGLERMAGGRLEAALKKITSNRLKCLLLGAGITAAIQSSSAMTVMLVGLVNSGIMSLGQSVGVIMGSNIGTTVTAWLLTLAGVESDNMLVSLLKPENLALIFAFVGVILSMSKKNARRRDMGTVLAGFAVLLYGMKLMSDAVKPLAEDPWFTGLFTAFRNPLLGVLAGFAVTAVIQSSSASVGILQALALTGAVPFGAAVPIIMGQNIGTCVTALISSVGVSRNAKRVALVHVAFNLIGTAVCLTLYCLVTALFDLPFTEGPIDERGIALVHTLFNVFTTAILLPFTGALEKLTKRLLPDRDTPEEPVLLDRRLLATPSVAIAECVRLTNRMAGLAKTTLENSLALLSGYDAGLAEEIRKNEEVLDRYEDALGTFLVQLSSKRLSENDAMAVSRMLHVIGDFERLGDHAVNLLAASQELHDKNLTFSQAAKDDLSVLIAAVTELLAIATRAYQSVNVAAAVRAEPLEQTIDSLTAAIKSRHIQRLTAGECSITLGFILSDVLTSLERAGDHCSNIAVAVIELSHRSFDTHKYLGTVRAGGGEYQEAYREFSRKYTLHS